METQNRVQTAQTAFLNGLSCCQSVLTQYCEIYGLDPLLAGKMASGFGGGLCTGKTCGALTGAILVLGLDMGFYSPETTFEQRQNLRDKVTVMIGLFEKEHLHTDCTDLLGMDLSIPGNREKGKAANISHTHCNRFIATAITTVDSIIAAQKRVAK